MEHLLVGVCYPEGGTSKETSSEWMTLRSPAGKGIIKRADWNFDIKSTHFVNRGLKLKASPTILTSGSVLPLCGNAIFAMDDGMQRGPLYFCVTDGA